MTVLAPRVLRSSVLLRHSHISCQYLYGPPVIFKALRRSLSTATTRTPTRPSPNPRSLSKVNGPPSTLPAPLIIPVRQKDQPFFPSYAFALGKAYLAFYKTGVWNVWSNFKASQSIQRHVDDKYSSSLKAAVADGALTRHDFQLLVRNWHDIRRVPLFALVVAVCGEFTPLVVIAVSNVVPWTCRIPKQVESDRRRLEERRTISFRNLTSVPPKDRGVGNLGRMELLHISWSLGLSSKMWDWLGGQLPGLPTWILRRKVRRRIEYLEMDDGLIEAGTGLKDMESEECKMACVERGINVLGRSDDQIRADLGAWLRSRKMSGIERLLLTRFVPLSLTLEVKTNAS